MNLGIALSTLTAIATSTVTTEPGPQPILEAQSEPPLQSDWSVDFGVRWFKHSSENGPNELAFNPVFDRWERINQDPSAFTVSDYSVLEPLYFNMNFGVDVFIRYKGYFLLRLGYDYSNPLGIGGKGSIAYTDAAGAKHEERKELSYTSHQINTFFGPLVPVDDVAEIYLGFSPMAPTWVHYTENYEHKVDGRIIRNYDEGFSGFFGSCRAMVGIQVRVTDRVKIGSEAVFAFLNYMELSGSGNVKDSSFRFPSMLWNFTARYEIF